MCKNDRTRVMCARSDCAETASVARSWTLSLVVDHLTDQGIDLYLNAGIRMLDLF